MTCAKKEEIEYYLQEKFQGCANIFHEKVESAEEDLAFWTSVLFVFLNENKALQMYADFAQYEHPAFPWCHLHKAGFNIYKFIEEFHKYWKESDDRLAETLCLTTREKFHLNFLDAFRWVPPNLDVWYRSFKRPPELYWSGLNEKWEKKVEEVEKCRR